MAGWPDSDDLENWLSSQSLSDEAQGLRLPYAFDAALETVQGDVDPELVAVDAETVPERLRLAVLILAHKLLTRADSPAGVIGFGEFAIRVSRDDPDYMKLVREYRDVSIP